MAHKDCLCCRILQCPITQVAHLPSSKGTQARWLQDFAAKTDGKVSATPIQDNEHFWVSQGISMVWTISICIHSLDAHQRHSVAVFFPRWVQNWITPGFGMNIFIPFPPKNLRSDTQQLLWESTCSKKVCSKTALFLQIANLYLGNEDHVPKVAKEIFKQKDTWGHIFIAQIDSVKSGFIEAMMICYAESQSRLS